MGKMEEYLNYLMSMEEFCERFKDTINRVAFGKNSKTNKILSEPKNTWYCWSPRYQVYWRVLYNIINICYMLGIEYLAGNKEAMVHRIMLLNTPWAIKTRENFENHVNFIKDMFEDVEEEIMDKLKLLNEEEKSRLDEALNCYIRGCNYAAIAMSVSAIEFRLLNLMQAVKPDPKLEKFTLGDLIYEYLQNKKEYKNVIPKKHEPLLNLCNTYRIFSVHPKKEKITTAIATSIINMTFAFLLDEKLKHKAEAK